MNITSNKPALPNDIYESDFLKRRGRARVRLALLIALFCAVALYASSRYRIAAAPLEVELRPNTYAAQTIRVHVEGNVNSPGVYSLPKGSYLADLLEIVGGFADDAARSSVNMAYKLDDGMLLHIPYPAAKSVAVDFSVTTALTIPTPEPQQEQSPQQEQPPIAQTEAAAATSEPTQTQPPTKTPKPTKPPLGIININKATAEELQALPKIGPVLSQAIVAYREANGSFTDIEQVKNIKGIGDKIFEQIKENITI